MKSTQSAHLALAALLLAGCTTQSPAEVPTSPEPSSEITAENVAEAPAFPRNLDSIAGGNDSVIPDPLGLCDLVASANFIGKFSVASIVAEQGEDVWTAIDETVPRTVVSFTRTDDWSGASPRDFTYMMRGGHLEDGGYVGVDHAFSVGESVVLLVDQGPNASGGYNVSSQGLFRIDTDDTVSGEYLFRDASVPLADLRGLVRDALTGNCQDVRPDAENRATIPAEEEPTHDEQLNEVED